MEKARITLGIETSCDETGVALYDSQKGIISSALFSQIELHQQFGGVLPELASRTQLEKIHIVFDAALQNAQLSLDDVDIIAITHKPGLPGSLLVGLCFGKMIAWSRTKKLVGVNHLEGHIFSSFLEHSVPFPHICITASGGHTALYLVEDFGQYRLLGSTRDDAAGEAFDKIAKLMNLNYPGGPEIEKLAKAANFIDYFHYPRAMIDSFDFSFSGLKTAILYHLIKEKAYDTAKKIFLRSDDIFFKQKVASSLLVCIGDIFEHKILLALSHYPFIKAVTFVGGCAANKYLTNRLQNICHEKDLSFFSPSGKYCTDNGAMIAFVGNYKAEQSIFSDWLLDIF